LVNKDPARVSSVHDPSWNSRYPFNILQHCTSHIPRANLLSTIRHRSHTRSSPFLPNPPSFNYVPLLSIVGSLSPPCVLHQNSLILCSHYSVTLNLSWNPAHDPTRYNEHAWPGFGVVLGINFLGLLVVIIRRDIVWAVAATWICVSVFTAKPKPAPVYVCSIFFGYFTSADMHFTPTLLLGYR
jgi:hypothetical protein